MTPPVSPHPSRATADPPVHAWRLGDRPVDARREGLAGLLETFGLHDSVFDPGRPVIATGHQAFFWHPGILAKDLAVARACERLGATPVHLVVDHDCHPALTLDVPVRRGGVLVAEKLRLGAEDTVRWTGARPPLTDEAIRDAIRGFRARVEGEVMVDLDALLQPLPAAGRWGSLADSITARQFHWMRPHATGFHVLRTSMLSRLPAFDALIRRMLGDAGRCVSAYNRAVAAVPEAGVAPLRVERDRVELPLWLLEETAVEGAEDLGGSGDSRGGRGRVFADLADSTPILTREDGTPIRRRHTGGADAYPVAPKALLLTAWVRSALCDLFVHGTGGGVYERVTERWWGEWAGEPLAPLAVVSADVHLGLDAPQATRAEADRAVWFRHHLPHNIDRYAQGLDPGLLAEKAGVVTGRATDHPTPARVRARRRLREINRGFAAQHAGLITQADHAVASARRGLANAAVAARRDWCFAFYPPEQLAGLKQRLGDPR